jgi:anti-anti-sigma factor
MIRIDTRRTPSGVLGIEMDSPLTAGSSRELLRVLETLLDSGTRGLILDVGAVRHIDLCGLGTLLEAAALAERCGAALRIVGPHPAVNPLVALRILTLDIAFQNGADALRSIHGQARAGIDLDGDKNPEQAAA